MHKRKNPSKTDGLPDIIEEAKRYLQDTEMQAILGEAQKRHECLRAFKNIYNTIPYIQAAETIMRDSIICALLQEFQRAPREPWGLVLLVVMEPMLKRLRRRVLDWLVESTDLDQMLIELFWEAISKFDTTRYRNRVILRLRKKVQKSLFCQVNKAQFTHQQHEQLKRDVVAYRFNPFDEIKDEDQIDVMVDILVQSLDGVLPEKMVNLIVQTKLQRRKIRECMEFSDEYAAEADQERCYQTTKRRLTRTVRKVRTLLIDYIDYDRTFLAQLQSNHHPTQS